MSDHLTRDVAHDGGLWVWRVDWAMVSVPLIVVADRYKYVAEHTAGWHTVSKAMVKYLT